MAFLQLNDVSKRFGPVEALCSFSLDVDEGELIAFLGPSGCGKTTTLSILAGFTEPTGGDIRIDGRSMRDVPAHKRNVGVVFQNYALFPHLNVWNNVAFGLKMRKVERADLVKRVQAAIDLVRLNGFESRYARELSGGQQQRVALARALVIEPSLLLLDEPLSNLDATLREEMRFEIRDIQQRIGITTIFVTHDQSEAMAMADRLVVMNKGRICQIGRPRDIYQSPVDPFVAKFIGGANLLRCAFIGNSDGLVRVETADGVALAAKSTTVADAAQSLELVFRPEDTMVSATSLDGCNNLPAVISRIAYLGASVEIAVIANGQSFSAVHRSGEDRDLKVGDRGFLSWKPDRSVLIAAADPSVA